MDLKQLEYFVRVAEMGSFTRASIALDVAQPALGRQVRLLEVELRQSPPGLLEDPPPSPIALRDIARLPLVIPSRPNAIRMHLEAEMAGIGCRPEIALEIDGVSAILDLVADGAGCAVLSRNAVASSVSPSAFTVRAICDPALRTRLSLVTSSLRPATLTQQATLALIETTAKAKLSES